MTTYELTDPRTYLNAGDGSPELAAWNECGDQHAELGRLPRVSEIANAGHEQRNAVGALAAYVTYHELWSELGEAGEPATEYDRLNVLRRHDTIETWKA